MKRVRFLSVVAFAALMMAAAGCDKIGEPLTRTNKTRTSGQTQIVTVDDEKEYDSNVSYIPVPRDDIRDALGDVTSSDESDITDTEEDNAKSHKVNEVDLPSPTPTATPKPTATPAPTATPKPTATPAPEIIPDPAADTDLKEDDETEAVPEPADTANDWKAEYAKLAREYGKSHKEAHYALIQATSDDIPELVMWEVVKGTDIEEYYNNDPYTIYSYNNGEVIKLGEMIDSYPNEAGAHGIEGSSLCYLEHGNAFYLGADRELAGAVAYTGYWIVNDDETSMREEWFYFCAFDVQKYGYELSEVPENDFYDDQCSCDNPYIYTMDDKTYEFVKITEEDRDFIKRMEESEDEQWLAIEEVTLEDLCSELS